MNKFTTKSALVAGLVAAAFAITATASAATFSTNLKQGSTGADVKNLQVLLNSDAATQIATVGAGSPGMETSYFGAATKAAVIKFQNKYASEVLTPAGLTSGTGFVGALTRSKLNTMGGSTTTTTTTTTGCTTAFDPATGKPCTGSTTTVVNTGAGVVVAAATQPANGLAIHGSSRVPFTKFTLTAGSADVVVNGVTVQRSGAAVDAVFAGVALIDETGAQFDIAKTFGSTHQAIIGGTFTVKAGTTKTFTVAGNMNSDLSSYAGQVASIDVVAVNTTGTVTGSLPITGSSQTVNNSLTIGTVTAGNSSYDPASAQTKEIGTTGYKFTGVRLTAGSAEDVRVHSIRFYQAGSAGASDLSNVKIYVDGTAYDTTVSSDGKYYSSSFGSGIVIAKGLAKDIWIAGDIVGSGSAGRTVDFDLQKNTDIYLTGETYGQGLIYTGTVNGSASTATPAINGYITTVSGGSVTGVTKANSVTAQNVAINLASQVLGGYQTDIKGEALSVQTQVFTVATSSGTGVAGLLTMVSLYDENGAVVAGPVDAVYSSATTETVTFTDTVTYPIGQHVYTLKGKLASNTGNNTVFTSTLTSWSNITGQTTGNTVASPTLGVALNPVTAKAASLAVTTAGTPAAQYFVAGGSALTFANFQFDASQSGEDVRFSSFKATNTGNAGISGCQLFDGATALNTGSNVVNPTSDASQTFTFDSPVTVAKNTVKTLTLKCNTSSAATGGYYWTPTISSASPVATGVTSGTTVVATGTATASATQTKAAGSLVVSLAPASPSYAIAAAGSTGNTASVIRFHAANEAVNLSRIALKLTSTSASAADLVQVSIWDGATQVGTATFTGSNSVATSTLSSTVVLPKDADKDLTVKVDLAQIGAGQTGTQGALIVVSINNADSTGTEGTGVSSGSTVDATGTAAPAGVRLFKSFPTFAKDTMQSTGVADGELMKFKVTANSNGGVGINKFAFTIATSTVTSVKTIGLYAYTDAAYSSPVSTFTSGLVQTTQDAATGSLTITPDSVINIPAGATYYFKLAGVVAGTQTGTSVTTTLLGDSTYSPSSVAYVAGGVGMATTSANVSGNLIWSGNATTTSLSTHVDWSNGAGVAGLPSSGLLQTRSN